MTGVGGAAAIQPQSPGLSERIWWGSGTRQSAAWAAEQGMNLMSSTLLSEDTGVPFGELQAEQIAIFRDAWAAAGWEREPRVSVSRSVLPVDERPRPALFRRRDRARRRRPDRLSRGSARALRPQLHRRAGCDRRRARRDPAVQSADTLLLTVPNQLGVEYNARLLETFVSVIAPAMGWESGAVSAAGPARD